MDQCAPRRRAVSQPTPAPAAPVGRRGLRWTGVPRLPVDRPSLIAPFTHAPTRASLPGLRHRPLREVPENRGKSPCFSVRGWRASNERVGRVVWQRVGVHGESGCAAGAGQEPGERVGREHRPRNSDWPQAFAVDRQIRVPEGEPHHAPVGPHMIRVNPSEQRFAVVDYVRQAWLSRRQRRARRRSFGTHAAPGPG